MKSNGKVIVSSRRLPLSGCSSFVNFALAFALVWVVLLLAPQDFAATGAMKNSNIVVCTLDAVDIGAVKGCKSSEVKSQAFLSSLSRCCEESDDHKQTPESCQTPCPTSGSTLCAIWVWDLPAHALLAIEFAPRVIGAPNSLLHQRLNRPPIIDCLA